MKRLVYDPGGTLLPVATKPFSFFDDTMLFLILMMKMPLLILIDDTDGDAEDDIDTDSWTYVVKLMLLLMMTLTKTCLPGTYPTLYCIYIHMVNYSSEACLCS